MVADSGPMKESDFGMAPLNRESIVARLEHQWVSDRGVLMASVPSCGGPCVR